jgi:hypothetical protein
MNNVLLIVNSIKTNLRNLTQNVSVTISAICFALQILTLLLMFSIPQYLYNYVPHEQ